MTFNVFRLSDVQKKVTKSQYFDSKKKEGPDFVSLRHSTSSSSLESINSITNCDTIAMKKSHVNDETGFPVFGMCDYELHQLKLLQGRAGKDANIL